jgi:hypothetical protein
MVSRSILASTKHPARSGVGAGWLALLAGWGGGGAGGGAGAREDAADEPIPAARVVGVALELAVDTAAQAVEGRETIRSDGPVRLRFPVYDLAIQEVTGAGSWELRDGFVEIESGGLVTVAYRGVKPKGLHITERHATSSFFTCH